MDRDVLERARWFSWRRQRLDRTCRGVEDCLNSVIGVPSANPFGPLSLLARVPRLLKGAAVEGVIGTKRAVRIPAMRRAIFMVPTDTAPLIFAATQTGKPYRLMLRRIGVDDEEYKRLRRDVLLAAGFPKTLEEIQAALPDPPDELGPVLQAMCGEGLLLRIKSPNIRSNALTYAATKVWLGGELTKVSQTGALAWLAGEYLTAFGPVSVEDFAWWAGVSPDQAVTALNTHELAEVTNGVFLHRKDERAFDGTRANLGRVSLLPKLDCYTMGYAPEGRARFVHPSLLPLTYDGSGDAQPVILVEGEVRGTWGFRFARDRITITLSMFDSIGPRLRAAMEQEVELVGYFLEAASVRIDEVRVERPSRRAPAANKTMRSKRSAPAKGIHKMKRPAKALAKRPARSATGPRRKKPPARPRNPRR
jgi:hypothetical protein